MKTTSRLIAVLLSACLVLGGLSIPALAAEPLFPTVNSYADAGFADVEAGSWYADAVKLCYETGLMNGTGGGAFAPGGTITVGEVAAIAARMGEALTGAAIVRATALPGESRAWYQDYVDYLTNQNVTVPTPTKNATRQEFLALLSAVVPQSELSAVNAITTLPDTQDADVLLFYNAGILTGTDVYGTFNGSTGLTRAEAASMVARVADPTLRQSFTPQEKPVETPAPATTPTLSYEEELMQTEAVRVNGASIPFSDYIRVLNEYVYETDTALKRNTGVGLDWNATYSDVTDLPRYFKQGATNRLVQETLVAAQARALGCDVDDLPAVLTPDPAQDLDHIYCAKHILVADEATATLIIGLIQQNRTLATFNQLLAQYGTDPGMESNPNGYLFTDGDMVDEFESAVKALQIGNCSNLPVKSDYGYHVILRLDPTAYPGWQAAWQELMYEDYVTDWMYAATVTTNDAELDKLDVQARYTAYLASLGG